MKRPSKKLLKDMSIEELSTESAWHVQEAANLFERVKEMREHALDANRHRAEEILQSAMAAEAEAEAHMHQSNLLDSLHAARLSDQGVGVVVQAAKV